MIETKNIYFASYLLNEGMAISNVEMRHDYDLGNTVVFIFNSKSLEMESKIEKEFNEGKALTNIREYLDNLVKVRDIVYSIMGKNIGGKINESRRTKRIHIKS